MIHISLVPVSHVDKLWDSIVEQVKRGTDTSGGRVDPPSMLNEILEGREHLWIAFNDHNDIKGVVTTTFKWYPKKKMLCGGICAGHDLHEWMEPMLDVLYRWQKDNSCDGFEFAGRKGWGRVLPKGWEPAHIVYEYKDIKNG